MTGHAAVDTLLSPKLFKKKHKTQKLSDCSKQNSLRAPILTCKAILLGDFGSCFDESRWPRARRQLMDRALLPEASLLLETL